MGQQQKLILYRQQVLNSRSIYCYYYHHWIEEVREVESFISKYNSLLLKEKSSLMPKLMSFC